MFPYQPRQPLSQKKGIKIEPGSIQQPEFCMTIPIPSMASFKMNPACPSVKENCDGR
jgi:hypothetical protein